MFLLFNQFYFCLQQKYFDSGDYNMEKSKGAKSKLFGPPQGTGGVIPTPDSLPTRKPSIVQSKLATGMSWIVLCIGCIHFDLVFKILSLVTLHYICKYSIETNPKYAFSFSCNSVHFQFFSFFLSMRLKIINQPLVISLYNVSTWFGLTADYFFCKPMKVVCFCGVY